MNSRGGVFLYWNNLMPIEQKAREGMTQNPESLSDALDTIERPRASDGTLVRRSRFLPGNAQSLSRHGTRQAYWSLAVLFAVYALNIADRQIINILAQDIKTEFGLSDGQLGLLTGTAFGIFYSVLAIPMGRLSDVMDRVRLIAIGLFAWSGFTALCGWAGSFAHLFMARMGVGVGEASSVPASTSLVGDLFPGKRRASAMSVLLVGAPVGSFLGLYIGGWIGSEWGWRAAFIVAGAPGVLVTLVMIMSMGDPRRQMSYQDPTAPFWTTIRHLFRQPRFGWIAAGLSCSSFFVIVVGAWLPPFLIRVHGLSTGETGFYTAIAVGIGGAVGTLGGGLLCDALRARVREAELIVIIGLTVLGGISLLITLLYPELTTALICMFIFNMCPFAILGPIVILIQREATAESRGLAVAICMSLSNIMNLIFALPLVGMIGDQLEPEYGVHAIGYSLAICGSFFTALALFVYWRALRQATRAAGGNL